MAPLSAATPAELEPSACVRQLAALSGITTGWLGESASAIGESACDLLIGVLHADMAYLQLRDPTTDRLLVTAVGGTKQEFEAALQAPAPRLAIVPLGPDSHLGRLAIGASRPDFPNELELLLLRAVADHAALALGHNALLFRHEQLQRRLAVRAAQEAAVAELGGRALTEMSLAQLLDEALLTVRGSMPADLGEVLELAPDGQSLLLRAGFGWRAGVVGQSTVDAGHRSQAGHALASADPVIVEDQRGETRFAESPLLLEHGAVASASVIIRDHHQPFGLLRVHSRTPRRFTADDVHHLQSIANLLGAVLRRREVEAQREALLLQARRAVEARDRAVRVVSHDLGNPLSTIQICASALLDPDAPPVSGMRSMAEIIQRSADWMRQIVEELLDRASLDAGRLVLMRRPTAVPEVMGAAMAVFAPVAASEAVELVVDVQAELPRVDADPHRLLQVLSNLLGNAVKFTPAGGRVGLSARVTDDDATDPPGRGGAVRFAVNDTGPGIPPEDLVHVTEWFWHAERTGRGGMGMGLAIANGLVEAHRRRLHVESVPGEGSNFWFTLPAVGL
jgi:signal transduction histidine kinase